MTTLWLRVQTNEPPESMVNDDTTKTSSDSTDASSTTTTSTTSSDSTDASSTTTTSTKAILPGSAGAGNSDIVNAKWVKSDPYFFSRLVNNNKGDLRLISRVTNSRGPDRVYCKGEYFDLIPNAFVQVYTRSDDAKPMRWFKAQVMNYLEEGVYSIKYEHDKVGEFYELHVTEDTWRPHFAF